LKFEFQGYNNDAQLQDKQFESSAESNQDFKKMAKFSKKNADDDFDLSDDKW